MSDIRSRAVQDTAKLHFRDASDELMYLDGEDGKPDESKPVAAIMYGPGSKQYQRAQAARNSKIVTRLKKKGKDDATPEEQREEQIKFLIGITHSFENIAYENYEGEALFRAVYSDLKLGYMAEQAGKFASEWGNFATPSTTSSSSTSAN